MKTICIAGKNDIAVDVMLHCKNKYTRCRLLCVINRNEKKALMHGKNLQNGLRR